MKGVCWKHSFRHNIFPTERISVCLSNERIYKRDVPGQYSRIVGVIEGKIVSGEASVEEIGA